MLRSLFSGISGLRAFQTMMDVTGNNIANVNTIGYKSSHTIFEDTLSQLLRGAGAPSPGAPGTNPAQVGLGVRIASIAGNFTQGAAQLTGRSTDLMIQGDGFFVVKAQGQDLYTRAGSFSFDANGQLVTPEGAAVQGWSANATGTIDTNAPVGDIQLPVSTLLQPAETTTGAFDGNLDASAAVGTVVGREITMYDAQGASHDMTFTYTKTAADTWSMVPSDTSGSYPAQTLTFDGTGAITSGASITITPSWGAGITLDTSKISQFAGESTLSVASQNGAGMGSLESFSMGNDGSIVGVFSNGLKKTLAKVALANFNNPMGLERVGNTSFTTSVNSGLARLGAPGTGGLGELASGTVEMSNVDLAEEFTNLIIAQRGFQANSRVITTSDQILETLVNMK